MILEKSRAPIVSLGSALLAPFDSPTEVCFLLNFRTGVDVAGVDSMFWEVSRELVDKVFLLSFRLIFPPVDWPRCKDRVDLVDLAAEAMREVLEEDEESSFSVLGKVSFLLELVLRREDRLFFSAVVPILTRLGGGVGG